MCCNIAALFLFQQEHISSWTFTKMHSFGKTAASALLVIICLLATECQGNQYDPHLYPSNGPFFEGWYLRLVDKAKKISLGFLFGRVLPCNFSLRVDSRQLSAVHSRKSDFSLELCDLNQHKDNPLVLAGVLVQDRNFSQKLHSFNGAFSVTDYSVTVKGKPVLHDPDDKSPADFSVKFGNNGSFSVSPYQTLVDVTVGNVSLFIQSGNHVPWGPHGEGPEGWLEHLPFPLHWFVYSLRSTVTKYRFYDSASGRKIDGANARLHMEKNWGQSFPAAWVWSQGLTETNITLALSGGIVDFQVLNTTAFLVGYRNPAKNIVWNFTPANSVSAFIHDGCQGLVKLNLTGLFHKLAIKIVSPSSYFSECLLGPERDGFSPVCVESYDAVISVTAYKRRGFDFVEVDRVDIYDAALEFGGKYVCKDKCSHL